MAHDVFISYSSKDKNVADAACALLEARGIRCWMAPRDILPGSEWGAAIIGAIGAARVMVLIYTSSSNASPQVRREVERAVARGLHVIPFRVEDVPMSPALEYFISSPHWLDALNPPLERHLDHLARIIKAVLDAQKAGAGEGGAAAGEELSAGGWTHGAPPGLFGQLQPQLQPQTRTAQPAGGPSRKLLVAGGVLGVLLIAIVAIIYATRPGKPDTVAGVSAGAGNAASPAVATMPAPPEVASQPVTPPVATAPVAPEIISPPRPAPPRQATPADVKRFWELLAEGSPRIGRLQELLGEYSALTRTKNPDGNTPLYEAAKAGQERIVALLLESGADPKAASFGGNTALHGAAEAGIKNPQIIEALAPGNLDARNADVRTALHVAAAFGHAETARLIAEAGADLNRPDKSGRTPLQLAMACDDPAKAHATALVLVNAGAAADSAAADKRGNAPLHLAAAAGDVPLLSAMIDKGAKIDRASPSGQTPLHVAVGAGRVEVVKALLARRAAVDAADDAGNTPLHLAAALKEPAIAELLLAAGAKVTAATTEKQTPLHAASAAGNVPLVELFMRNGGAAVLTGGKSPTPIDVAEKAGRKDVVALLRRMEFPLMLQAAIRNASQPPPPRLLEMLRKNPALADASGEDRRNALHQCAAYGNAAFAAELVKINPDLVKAFSAAEETPLHVAAANKQAAVARVLLVAGASVRATTGAGDTPLHVAARAGAGEVIKALLDAGADPDVNNKEGSRAVDVAKDPGVRKTLTAAEAEANAVRDFWSSFQLDDRGFDVTGPGLTQSVRLRFSNGGTINVEGNIGGAYKSFEGSYKKGSLTLSLQSSEGAIFPGLPGTLYVGKVVPGADESKFAVKVGDAQIQFARR